MFLSQKTLAAASLLRPRPRPRFFPPCFCRRSESSPSAHSHRPRYSFSSSARREATCCSRRYSRVSSPHRVHRVEAPSSSLRCHHREERRLPLAHLLHPYERAVATEGRNARLASSQGGQWTGGMPAGENHSGGHLKGMPLWLPNTVDHGMPLQRRRGSHRTGMTRSTFLALRTRSQRSSNLCRGLTK